MRVRRTAVGLAAVLTGLSAGFFVTYEASVVRALAQVDDHAYVTVFRAINTTIRNPLFGLVFFGAVVAGIAALVLHRRADPTSRALVGLGVVLYLGGLVVTAAGNVPLNEQLAAATTATETGVAAARLAFESNWNTFNLVRTVLVVGSFVSFVTVLARPVWPPDSPSALAAARSASAASR